MERKKQLRQQYKETPRPMGVFRIINTENNKMYIGSSMNVTGKLNGTRFQLEMKGHYNKMLQHDWDQYGATSFGFEVLEMLDPDEFPSDDWPEALQLLEEKWLDELQPFNERGYNKKKEKNT